MTFAILLSLVADDPPKKELPSVEDVRTAFKANLDRMRNRRVHYVVVTLPGDPKKEFPPLDHPDRTETEEVQKKGDGPSGPLSCIKRSVFQGGSLRTKTIEVKDRTKFTRLKTDFTGRVPTSTAEFHFQGVGRSDLSAFEMRVRHLVEGWEGDRMGKSSTVKASPLGGGLLELSPWADGRSSRKERWTLDPSKNFWPIRYESKGQDPKLKVDVWRLDPVEFFPRPMLYPKKVSFWNSPHDSTTYYTATFVEFPKEIADAEFVVAIPPGATVFDQAVLKKLEPNAPSLVKHLDNEDGPGLATIALVLVIVIALAVYVVVRWRMG